jgi:hypothetical protein
MGGRGQLDFEIANTEGYESGELLLTGEFYLPDVLIDKYEYGTVKRKMNKNDLDEWQTLFWDILNDHDDVSKVLMETIKEFNDEKDEVKK